MTTTLCIEVKHLPEGKHIEVSQVDASGETVGLSAVLRDLGSVAMVHAHNSVNIVLKEVDDEVAAEPVPVAPAPIVPDAPVDQPADDTDVSNAADAATTGESAPAADEAQPAQ